MTENTPTPANPCDWPECPGVAQERHEIESGPELHDLCKRVLAVTAERDALAAVIEQAPHWAGCDSLYDRGARCHCWKSVAPALVLAQRDARVLDRIIKHLKSTVRLGLGLTDEQKQDRRNIIEWLEADRIEREAQG